MHRINTGTLVSALGAFVLLVSLFLHWYRPDLTAWTAFEVWDLVLAGLAVATLVTAAADGGWWRGPVPAPRSLAVGLAALVIVVVELINHPPAAIGRGLEGGAWVALAGAALMSVGALMAEARISLSLRVDRQGRVGTSDRTPAATTAARPVGGAEPPSPATARAPVADPVVPPAGDPARPDDATTRVMPRGGPREPPA